MYSYLVRKTKNNFTVDSNWNKIEWTKCDYLQVNNSNNWENSFEPKTDAKLTYSNDYIYIIFRVNDNYILATEDKINSEVWKDSCVEFFFSPKCNNSYFNLEMNAIGTILFSYYEIPRKKSFFLSELDIKKINIKSTFQNKIENEINDNTTWYLEVKIPIKMLNKYLDFEMPNSKTVWKANFFKCAEKNSKPHWLSWTKIDNPLPDFHLPNFFGEIHFE